MYDKIHYSKKKNKINMCPKTVKKEEAIRFGPEPQEKDTEKEKNTKGSEVLPCEQIQTV